MGETLCIFCFFFFFCVFVSCPFFATLSLRVAVWNEFSGASFCFLWSVVVLCFSVVFCLGFRFMVWRLAPEIGQTILFMSGLLFCAFAFSFFLILLFSPLLGACLGLPLSFLLCSLAGVRRRQAGAKQHGMHFRFLFVFSLPGPPPPLPPFSFLSLSISMYSFSIFFFSLSLSSMHRDTARGARRVTTWNPGF